jgi:hypothetical protein
MTSVSFKTDNCQKLKRARDSALSLVSMENAFLLLENMPKSEEHLTPFRNDKLAYQN